MEGSKDERIQRQENEQVQMIDISLIKPNPYQPRKTFDSERLNDLADSIKQHGVLQPIVLRQTVKGYYIVAGERRFRASKIAGNQKISAIIKDLSDEDMMELAIIENLQREDLNAIEEAESYHRLISDLNITQQEVATRLGKSRPYIANMLRLLNLPPSLKRLVSEGKLSGAHGRTLLAIKDNHQKLVIAKKVIKESWSVRYLENYVSEFQDGSQSKTQEKDNNGVKPKFIQKQERLLKEQYGTNIEITTKNNVGKIVFEFKSKEEFQRLIKQLNDD